MKKKWVWERPNLRVVLQLTASNLFIAAVGLLVGFIAFELGRLISAWLGHFNG